MISGCTLRLQINQQSARLGMDRKPAQLQISQPKAELSFRQTPAQMEIIQGLGKLHIDGTNARAALGLKPSAMFISDIAQQSRQIALEAISAISETGDQLAAIEKGTTIAEIARQNYENPGRQIDYTDAYSPLNISYTPHPFAIDWIPGGADISITPRLPEISYTPGTLNIYVAQWNSLQFDVKGKYMNIVY